MDLSNSVTLPGGFFSSESVASAQTISRLTGCAACGLYKGCKSPKMEATGRGEKGILIISEQPGSAEDEQGRPLVGGPGKFMRKKLRDFGIDLDNDCVKVNAISCNIPGDKAPSTNEISHCRPRILRLIDEMNPKLILLLGGAAVTSVIGGKWIKKLDGINKWRGWTIPDREYNAWVCPTFHPAYVIRNSEKRGKFCQPVIELIFDKDLRRALKKLDEPMPNYMNEKAFVHTITSPKELNDTLIGLLEWETLMAFDFETTGLKLHAKGHRIVSMSYALDGKTATAFLMPKIGSRNHKLLLEIMRRKSILKMAHNMKYEDNAWNVRGGGPVEGWFWDSMLAAHCIDNRPGVTGLKFLAYAVFGILPYDEHISHLLKSNGTEAGGNSFNRIDEIPIEDLLLYNGMDSMIEFRLALWQMKKMGVKLP